MVSAWAGSFDALLHKDCAGVNQRTADECVRWGAGILQPVACVNPVFPDWIDDLRRCVEDHGMRIVRLHPNYHGYDLQHPGFLDLLDKADDRSLTLQIAVRMEDPRTQHPLLRVPDVELAPLPDLLHARPKLRVVLCNLSTSAGPDGGLIDRLAACPGVFLDVAMLEGVGGIGKLMERIPFERILFGSYFPFFVLQSALLKLAESELGDHILRAIAAGNARRLVLPDG